MDHVRTKSKVSQIKRPAIIAAIVLALVSGGVMLASIDFSTQRVDRTALSVEAVQQGTMEVKVGASGQLLPRHIEQLAAQVSGRVAKADIKPGAVVRGYWWSSQIRSSPRARRRHNRPWMARWRNCGPERRICKRTC